MIKIESIHISQELLTLIAEIDEFKGSWQLFDSLMPERLKSLKRIATIESIGSSTRIEGVKLSDQEIEQLLSNATAHTFSSRDEQEVAGYSFVCNELFDSYEHIPFTENSIRQLHAWLLKYSEKDARHRGEYKKFPNNVEAFDENGKSLGIVFKTTSPFDTPSEMNNLLYWTREQLEVKVLHPLLVIGIFIVIFLSIHPFQDGNGRLSRILTTLLLLKLGYHYVPYSSLESVIEKNKEGYYLSLRRTQQTLKKDVPDFNPWLLFFVRSLQRQKRHLQEKITRFQQFDEQLPKLSAQIVSLIRKYGKMTISEIEQLTEANRNTLKVHLKELVKKTKISQHGKGRGTWYSLFIKN